jgi:SAM-dependent methyltransferase
LDFGCGGGVFLERMHRQGWTVTGLDVSATAVHSIRTTLGLPALAGTLPHRDLAPASFDLITMWHSLEHVHDPVEVLQNAYDLLVSGGTLLVAVPNIESLAFRWFGPSWHGLDLPRHLTHFSPPTLREVLERADFEVDPVRMFPHSGWMRNSARLACQGYHPSFWQWLLQGKIASRLATRYSSVTGRCDCILVMARKA